MNVRTHIFMLEKNFATTTVCRSTDGLVGEFYGALLNL